MLELGFADREFRRSGLFRGYMDENFVATQARGRPRTAELLQLSRNAFESTWLPRAAKDRYLGELDAYSAR